MQPTKYGEQPVVVENLCVECIHLIVKKIFEMLIFHCIES